RHDDGRPPRRHRSHAALQGFDDAGRTAEHTRRGGNPRPLRVSTLAWRSKPQNVSVRRGGVSRSLQLIALLPKNRRGDSAQIAAKDLQPLIMRQIGVEHLRELGRIRTGRAMPAPDQSIDAYLADRVIDLP